MDKTKSTAKAFAYEWSRFSKISHLYEEEFLDIIKPIKEDFFNGKIVLDAGCGSGRFAYHAAKFGAKKLIAVDISDSVNVAYKNLKGLPNICVVKADINNLPFKEKFDLVYSIGVLHHLPMPEKGFSKLTEVLKEGGGIFAWVYAYEGNYLFLTFIEPIRRYFTSKLPLPMLKIISFFLAVILWLIITVIYLPLNKIKIFKPIAKILPMNNYLLYQYKLGISYLWLTTLDKLVPSLVEYLTKTEFTGWFTKAGLTEILVSRRNGNSWRGFGIKNKTKGFNK